MLTGHDREPLAQRMGPYEVLLDIGSGGMGSISLARATGEPVGVDGFARLVALKRPLGALSADVEVMQRFLDEARLLAQVHHANVVGIHQIGSDTDGHFLVLDYIEGGTLDEMITRSILHRRKLPPPIVLRVMGDVLAGLHAVHEAADVEGRPLLMLHRDVSTHNVLIGRDGVTRLADFGIAKAITSSAVTDKAYLQGRIPYMSPEYLRRDSVDRRIDVYAAGMTMWTALAGRLPWGEASEAQIVKNIVFDGVPSLASAGVTVAPAIEEIVMRACARDPSRRFASAREMLDALEALGRSTGWVASYGETAALVEELLGREFRARRSALAKRLSSPEVRSSPASGSEAPASPPAPISTTQRSRTPVTNVLTPQSSIDSTVIPVTSRVRPLDAPRQSGPTRVFLSLAVVVVAAAFTVAIWKWRGNDPPPVPQLAAPPLPVANSAPSPVAPPATTSESPSPGLTAVPTATVAAAGAQRASGSSALLRPAHSTASASQPLTTPTSLPSGISTSNPYR